MMPNNTHFITTFGEATTHTEFLARQPLDTETRSM